MSADVPTRLKPKPLAQHNDRRPDGLSLMPWSNGRCLAWDFTCPDTLAPSHLNTAITGQGAVAIEAEAKKKSKYAGLLPTFDFISTVVKTLGSLGDEAYAFLHQLGRRIMSVTGERRATSFCDRDLVLPSSGGMPFVCWAQSTLLEIVRAWTLCTIYRLCKFVQFYFT